MITNHARQRLLLRYGIHGQDAEDEIMATLRHHPALLSPVLVGARVECRIDHHGMPLRLLCATDPRTKEIEVISAFPPPNKKRKRHAKPGDLEVDQHAAGGD